MKRGRVWDASSSSEDEEGHEGETLTRSHPWGVRPLGNLYAARMMGAEEAEEPRAALGALEALDDSALLSVLSFLAPPQLARLGQTCRAAAVYCDHEPLWKDLLVRHFGGAWTWRGSFRDSFAACWMRERGREAPEPHRPFPVRGLYSDLLSKSWLCATARFNRAWMGPDTVPREHHSELSVEDFVRRYEAANRPVIITGAMADWPLYRELDAWLEKRADTEFKVGPARMPLAAFLEYARNGVDEDPLYLFDKHFATTCPELPELYRVPDYWAPERDLFSLLGEEERPDYRWLIAGSPCSGSAFHIDPNGTSAWNAVFYGAKKWVLAPKSVQIPGVYPNASFGEVATTISAVEWFVDFYAQLKQQNVPVQEVIQRPGEIIFVPQGWFHVVLNLESSLAITHNYVSETNVYNVMKFLEEKPDQVSGVSESKKHALGPKFRQALQDKAPHVLDKIAEREAELNAPSEWDLAKAGPAFSLLGSH